MLHAHFTSYIMDLAWLYFKTKQKELTLTEIVLSTTAAWRPLSCLRAPHSLMLFTALSTHTA